MTVKEIAQTIIDEDMGARRAAEYKKECYLLYGNGQNVIDFLEEITEEVYKIEKALGW